MRCLIWLVLVIASRQSTPAKVINWKETNSYETRVFIRRVKIIKYPNYYRWPNGPLGLVRPSPGPVKSMAWLSPGPVKAWPAKASLGQARPFRPPRRTQASLMHGQRPRRPGTACWGGWSSPRPASQRSRGARRHEGEKEPFMHPLDGALASPLTPSEGGGAELLHRYLGEGGRSLRAMPLLWLTHDAYPSLLFSVSGGSGQYCSVRTENPN